MCLLGYTITLDNNKTPKFKDGALVTNIIIHGFDPKHVPLKKPTLSDEVQ